MVIENQLYRSDHDHLGKLLAYLVATGAKTGVWILYDPMPEHSATLPQAKRLYSRMSGPRGTEARKEWGFTLFIVGHLELS